MGWLGERVELLEYMVPLLRYTTEGRNPKLLLFPLFLPLKLRK